MNEEVIPAPVRVLRMATGAWVAQCIYVAAKLRIPDLLTAGPRSAEELAEATGAHAASLARVLRGLVAHGILDQHSDGRFSPTELGEYLRDGIPGSVRNFALMLGEEHHRAWGELIHTVRTGEPAFDHLFGMRVFDYFAKHPEPAEIFNRAMTEGSIQMAEGIVASYDFAPFSLVVDVAGGQGRLLAAILRAHPGARGILFDLPQAIDGARAFIESEGLADRCELVAGDFFQVVPSGGDCYVLKAILHDWPDDEAVRILESCRRAMTAGATLVTIERVMPERLDQSVVAQRTVLSDLNMMVMLGGRERTEAEYARLLDTAGFRLARVVPTPVHAQIVEARAV